MKVLINASIFSGDYKGLDVYVRNIIDQVDNERGKFEFIIISFHTFNCKHVSHRRIKYGFFQRLISFNNLSLYRVIWNFLFLPFITKGYDLIYSLSPHGSPCIKNQIITVHDLIGYAWDISKFQAIYYRLVLPCLLKNSISIIAISEYTKGELIKTYGISHGKVKVIYNGTDHLNTATSSECPSQRLKNKKFIMAVGASFSHKNLFIAIEAVKNLRDIQLVIIGKRCRYLNSLLEKVRLERIVNVLFLSDITDSNISWLYRHAIANIFISLKEGFGMPPMEAINHGCVSIVSDIPCFREIYGDDAVIYTNPHSSADLTEKINLLIIGEINREKILINAELKIKLYSWYNMKNELLLHLKTMHKNG
jgi:glycosyltransferase involved in cell wall biosynthesis